MVQLTAVKEHSPCGWLFATYTVDPQLSEPQLSEQQIDDIHHIFGVH